jgi:Fe-Mn family superoxide dismutase
MAKSIYKARDFNLSGLEGISDKTLEGHFTLYKGYVKNTDLLNEQIMEIIQKSEPAGTNLAYAELTRHLGFEYGGMVLHEYYFDNLSAKGRGAPSPQLKDALEKNFGGFEKWKQAFVAVGEMRGVGWAILYEDPATEKLSNHWIALHQDGVPSGFKPILLWMFGSMLLCWTTRPRAEANISRRSFPMLIGTLPTSDSKIPPH